MIGNTTLRSDEFTLSTPERIGFGAGSLATATFATVPGLVLLYYLTDVLGIGSAIAGFVVFLPKLLDLIYNPIIGRLSDTTVTRLGPRRPWMIAGAIAFPVAFVSIFFSPFEGNAAAWWVIGALATTGLAFSAFVVPYSVLPAELGANSAERTSMIAWRMGFLGLAILLTGTLAPMLAESNGGGRGGYRLMALVMGGVILVGACAALYSARRSTQAAADLSTSGAGSLREAIGAARRNQPFRILLAVFMLLEIVMSVTLAGLPYVAAHLIGNEGAVPAFFSCVVGPMLVTMPIWRRAAAAAGKKTCLLVASSLYGLGVLGAIVLPITGESARFATACTTFVLAGIGFAGVQLLPQAMLADTLAVDASESDQRRAGLLTGLWSAGETVAAAFGAGLYGFVLAASNFISSENDESVVQPRSAEWGIVLGFSGISILSIIIAIAFLSRYPLTERRVDVAAVAAKL